jgi:hypothetical protein
LSAVTVFFLVNPLKIKAKQHLGKRPILPEASFPGKQNRASQRPFPTLRTTVRSLKESAKV